MLRKKPAPDLISNKKCSRSGAEYFQEKWAPVFRRKCNQKRVFPAAGRRQGARLRAVPDRFGAGRLRRHRLAQHRDRRGYGPWLRPARAGVNHSGLRRDRSDRPLPQDPRKRSHAGVATDGHDPRIDRAVCRAVLHARAHRRLHRDRAGRRRGHGARALATTRTLRLSALLFAKGLGLPFRLWPPFWP